MNKLDKKIYFLRSQLPNYLKFYAGINYEKNFKCLNPNHIDSHPSMGLDKRAQQVHCFACGARYDIFDVIGLNENINTFPEQLNRACELYGLQVPTKIQVKKNKNTSTTVEKDFSLSEYFYRCHEHLNDTDYLFKRGYSKEVLDYFNIGFDENFKTNTGIWKAIIIPTGDNSYVARNTALNVDSNERYRKYGKNRLFNTGVLDDSESKFIFVCEGELDALSIIQMGKSAIGLGSLNNKNKLISLLKDKNTENLTIILALDNDRMGREVSKGLLKELESLRVNCYDYNIYDTYKDANEILISNPKRFEVLLNEAIDYSNQAKEVERLQYLENNTTHYLQDFSNKIKNFPREVYISTGFRELDNILDGGFYTGLYIIGAVSSLGKTTFALQIADQVAKSRKDVLFFSLEMSREELISKSISKNSFLITRNNSKYNEKHAKSCREISNSMLYSEYTKVEKSLIDLSIEQYSTCTDNLFIYEGTGDIGTNTIREKVKQHIYYTGNKPLVVVDYLQILVNSDRYMTDKQNVDKSVVELKRISRDFDIPILVISSFNRANYFSSVSMESFKESGSIEYSSDVLLGLQFKGAGGKGFDIIREQNKNPRNVELVVLKNRSGISGMSIPYRYYARYNLFEEVSKVISNNDTTEKVIKIY